MSVLDRLETYERLDPDRMRALIATLPAQARAAWQAGQDWELPASFTRPERVLVLGVGGSAIGADLVAKLGERMSTVPVQIVRDYITPVFDDRTLVVAASYSGETEETLHAFQPTLDLPGMRLALTSGGKLGRLAETLGYAVFQYEFGGVPRAAIGWGIFPLLAILRRLGALEFPTSMVEGALHELEHACEDWRVERPFAENAAKQIATGLHGRIPLVVGPGFFEVAARRWAAQFNENSSQWAFHTELPEADHNLIAGFGAPAFARDALHVLFLDSTLLHERTRLRIRLTGEALDRAGISHDELLIGGDDTLDAVLRATYLGDWVSLYLAMLNEVDPMLVEPLDRIKAEMRRHG